MKLARINHIRCGEYTACTFVWVRDDMTLDELEERVEAAEKEYLGALKDFAAREEPPSSPWARPNWEEHRDRSVGEVLDEFEAKRREAAEYAKLRQGALDGFDSYLHRQEGIQSFWDHELEMEAEVDWGHQHGAAIEYGETEWPRFRLLRPAKRSKPGSSVMVISDSEEWV